MKFCLNKNFSNIDAICEFVKNHYYKNDTEELLNVVVEYLSVYPHSAELHNLIGLILEKDKDHISAMKHFRAAIALDPTYLPARINLNYFGDFNRNGMRVFCVKDCKKEFI